MELTNKQAFNGLIFILSSFILAILAGVSFIVAWAHDEGTINEGIGYIGYYSFCVFRFPTHNLLWYFMPYSSRVDFFFLGLFINVLLYVTLTTFIVSRIRGKTAGSKE
jgi:hypothetical protein